MLKHPSLSWILFLSVEDFQCNSLTTEYFVQVTHHLDPLTKTYYITERTGLNWDLTHTEYEVDQSIIVFLCCKEVESCTVIDSLILSPTNSWLPKEIHHNFLVGNNPLSQFHTIKLLDFFLRPHNVIRWRIEHVTVLVFPLFFGCVTAINVLSSLDIIKIKGIGEHMLR